MKVPPLLYVPIKKMPTILYCLHSDNDYTNVLLTFLLNINRSSE